MEIGQDRMDQIRMELDLNITFIITFNLNINSNILEYKHKMDESYSDIYLIRNIGCIHLFLTSWKAPGLHQT